MSVLGSEFRKVLEDACVKGRRVAEGACGAALGTLGVVDERVPSYLGDSERVLRRGLRAKSRQLGDESGSVALLVADAAYEQWHRLLFARFLAENSLLIHPEYRAPMTLAECDELAGELGEPDGWAVAGRFAAQILPGIFRLDDPCVLLRLAPEGRLALEGIVAGLPVEVFVADDSLGWVYQYWQREKKDEVNASERKIGGADLGPVTQLFTENYMVRFLLENSLGAWWAARHPESPLLKEWVYLRFDDEGAPAAGSFDGWPGTVAEVTVMDPCCGSGHFLVEAFSMLWQMRAEEEGLSPVAAQDAVLVDNLFGLELDPRCVQIAMFAVAITAWKAGGGWRVLPVPNIACSGIPVKAPVEEWKALAGGDPKLENALVRLHILFRDADTLGSLIDPKRAVEITDPTGLQQSFEDMEWDDIAPLLTKALGNEANDPATAVLGADAAGIVRAADYLSRRLTLIVTNVPFLSSGKQCEVLKAHISSSFPFRVPDLGNALFLRFFEQSPPGGVVAVVTPDKLLQLKGYQGVRTRLLAPTHQIVSIGLLGVQSFRTPMFDLGIMLLTVANRPTGRSRSRTLVVDAADSRDVDLKMADLATSGHTWPESLAPFLPSDNRIVPSGNANLVKQLSATGESACGLNTEDQPRFLRFFWEFGRRGVDWEYHQGTVSDTLPWGGMEEVVFWQSALGVLHDLQKTGKAILVGGRMYGRRGVLLSLTGKLNATLYWGGHFSQNAAVVTLNDDADTIALWSFLSDPDFATAVRAIDNSIKVTPGTLTAVPFDVDYWREVAAERYPDGLPEPWSDDPTQWLFEGRPDVATEPLQVAVGRLLGFRWPEQPEADDLEDLADDDGIVCLPSVLGERTAADRLLELLASAFGDSWSPGRTGELIAATGSKKKDLESWLRDDFFKAHCQVFKNRPFVWQVWDGRKDGFSALVNYHRLDRPTLERLAYVYLGDWIERQTASVREDVAGAEARLAAAQDLKARLVLVLEGEAPYDIFVRWKELGEQCVGWNPDLNDGVRLNVRPFVEAGVLRAKFNVKWEKDRGRNPDGSERFNDVHYTLEEKQAAKEGPS